MPKQSIQQVLNAHRDSIMAISGVVGVGQGECDGASCIRVYAAEMTSAIKESLPDTLEGYPVEVEVSGPIRPQSPR